MANVVPKAKYKEVVKKGDIPQRPSDGASVEDKIRYGINMAYFAIDMVKNACTATADVAEAVSDLVVKIGRIAKTTGAEMANLEPYTMEELRKLCDARN